MNVKLIGFSSDPEKIPAMAAKLTHSIAKPEDLEKTPKAELNSILKHVLNLGHNSIIEHTNFTFAISDVSRSLTHQLVRHRIASYAQQSQRYVNLTRPNYVIPPKMTATSSFGSFDETGAILGAGYTISATGDANGITFLATPNLNLGYKWTITCSVTPTNIVTKVVGAP